jgi:hypothetical protein
VVASASRAPPDSLSISSELASIRAAYARLRAVKNFSSISNSSWATSPRVADVFVGGVLCTLSAWVMENQPFMVRVRVGREVRASLRPAFMVLHFMPKSNQVVPKKGRGRPATGRDPVTAIRLSKELRATVDKWAAKQDDKPGRSEAIRRLVELGLKAKK